MVTLEHHKRRHPLPGESRRDRMATKVMHSAGCMTGDAAVAQGAHQFTDGWPNWRHGFDSRLPLYAAQRLPVVEYRAWASGTWVDRGGRTMGGRQLSAGQVSQNPQPFPIERNVAR